jgi:hypothetical protein
MSQIPTTNRTFLLPSPEELFSRNCNPWTLNDTVHLLTSICAITDEQMRTKKKLLSLITVPGQSPSKIRIKLHRMGITTGTLHHLKDLILEEYKATGILNLARDFSKLTKQAQNRDRSFSLRNPTSDTLSNTDRLAPVTSVQAIEKTSVSKQTKRALQQRVREVKKAHNVNTKSSMGKSRLTDREESASKLDILDGVMDEESTKYPTEGHNQASEVHSNHENDQCWSAYRDPNLPSDLFEHFDYTCINFLADRSIDQRSVNHIHQRSEFTSDIEFFGEDDSGQ